MSLIASFASLIASSALATSVMAQSSAPPAPAAPPAAKPPATAPAPAAKPPLTTAPAPAAPPATTAPAPTTPPAAAPATPAPAKAWVIMETSKGTIVLELDGEKAPISVNNFLAYVRKGFYDNTLFHRVMSDFMIQGGGFDTSGTQKETDPPIKNEYQNGLKNSLGTIAMARLPNPDSATAQFFINVVDNARLDGNDTTPGYAVFGKVVGGMSTVEGIRWVPTANRTLMSRGPRGTQASPAQNVPVELVVIKSVREATEADAKAAADAANAVPMPPRPATPPKQPITVPPGRPVAPPKTPAGTTPPASAPPAAPPSAPRATPPPAAPPANTPPPSAPPATR